MRGAYALAFLFEGEENLLIGARQGAPLAVGYGEGKCILAPTRWRSLPSPICIAYLEEGDWVSLTREGAVFRDASGKVVTRRKVKSQAGSLLIEKGNYRHFMAKEIHEQPEVVGHTLAHYIDMGEQRVRPFAWPVDPAKLSRHHDLRLRHRLYGRADRQILDRALSRACRSKSTSPPNIAIARRRSILRA